MIRNLRDADESAVMNIVLNSGEFDADGVEHVRSSLAEHLANADSPELWLVPEIDGAACGVAYTRPEPVTSGTWNLLMLWLAEGFEGQGLGTALVEETVAQLRTRGARLLIVETSGTDGFATARRFYERAGFTLEARIEDFFDTGDAKLVYTKRVHE